MADKKGTTTAASEAPENTNSRQVSEATPNIAGPRPGATLESQGQELSFEDLGNLVTFDPDAAQTDEGTGEWMTILFEVVRGAGTAGYSKGDVVRLSKLIDDYGVNDGTRAEVLRLVKVGAIRKATRDEIRNGKAIVTVESESQAVRDERAKRMAAEEELAKLKAEKGIPDVPAESPATKLDWEED